MTQNQWCFGTTNHDLRPIPHPKRKKKFRRNRPRFFLGVTFLKNPSSLVETRREPYPARYNKHRHPRLSPAIYQVSVTGPYESKEAGDTLSRRKIFLSYPTKFAEEDACAQRIVSALVRKAYRRPVDGADLVKPMEFYREAKMANGFEAGIGSALSAVLISPEFLFRIERDPADVGETGAPDVG